MVHDLSVILVHGAWADGSSWRSVTHILQLKGLHVIAAPLPLTSLDDDVKALDRALQRADGRIILAAHAYAGAVISRTLNDRVRALVFIAALTPDKDETVADMFYRDERHPQAPQLSPDADGFIWMPESGFSAAFAQYASAEKAALLAASQRPIHLACLHEKAGPPLWRSLPSWYLVAEEDRMIHWSTQRFMAQRMRANMRTAPIDHFPLVTAPHVVAEILTEAIEGASKSAGEHHGYQ